MSSDSVTKDFELYCDRQYLIGLSGSVFFIGKPASERTFTLSTCLSHMSSDRQCGIRSRVSSAQQQTRQEVRSLSESLHQRRIYNNLRPLTEHPPIHDNALLLWTRSQRFRDDQLSLRLRDIRYKHPRRLLPHLFISPPPAEKFRNYSTIFLGCAWSVA